MPRRRIHYTDPVVPIEYPVDEDPIHPCNDCLPWHVEVVVDHPSGGVWVREWHAVECPFVERWLTPDE
jgi:hypothetical protein